MLRPLFASELVYIILRGMLSEWMLDLAGKGKSKYIWPSAMSMQLMHIRVMHHVVGKTKNVLKKI